ncbi:MAG TPA: FHA domain-containing protein, partial [Kofleriaceae bacterium]
MGRAPNPGAPQRVSAHVVPKATAFSAEDDEKTTIESGGWEEEASTTVEQGEVADKLRALGALGVEARRSGSNTNITSTNGSGVSDEPTVDDQRASAALALLPPPTVARIVVTSGNDSGRSLEVRPGKTYTIGRGVDNDLVLTDITASRKHFDIRNENGSWILADRGSGNGTLVNSRIEDAPFMLASGDTIEVGNTAFRFDLISSAISLPGLPREPLTAASRRDAPPAVNGRDAPAGDLPRLNPEDPDSIELATPAVGPERPVVREPPKPPTSRDQPAVSAPRDLPELRELANGVPHEVPSVPTYDGSVDDDLEMSTVSGKPLTAAEPPRHTGTAS